MSKGDGCSRFKNKKSAVRSYKKDRTAFLITLVIDLGSVSAKRKNKKAEENSERSFRCASVVLPEPLQNKDSLLFVLTIVSRLVVTSCLHFLQTLIDSLHRQSNAQSGNLIPIIDCFFSFMELNKYQHLNNVLFVNSPFTPVKINAQEPENSIVKARILMRSEGRRVRNEGRGT